MSVHQFTCRTLNTSIYFHPYVRGGGVLLESDDLVCLECTCEKMEERKACVSGGVCATRWARWMGKGLEKVVPIEKSVL